MTCVTLTRLKWSSLRFPLTLTPQPCPKLTHTYSTLTHFLTAMLTLSSDPNSDSDSDPGKSFHTSVQRAHAKYKIWCM
jgi:hypothetical protein